MAKATVKCVQLKKGMRAAPAKKAAAPGSDFVLTVGVDGDFTVFGTDGTTDANGDPTQRDISSMAAMTTSSSDASKVAVTNTGVTGKETAQPGSEGSVGTVITCVVTFNPDPSGAAVPGPFTITDTVDVQKAPPPPPPPPISGLILVHNVTAK